MTFFCIFLVLRLRSDDVVQSTQAKFLVHTMQLIPHKFCKTLETQKILPVSTENETIHYFRVQVDQTRFASRFFCLYFLYKLNFCKQDNNVLEVCIAKFWSNFGETNLRSTIEFHGIHINGSSKHTK